MSWMKRLDEWRADSGNRYRVRVVTRSGHFYVYDAGFGYLGTGATVREALADSCVNHPELCGGAS